MRMRVKKDIRGGDRTGERWEGVEDRAREEEERGRGGERRRKRDDSREDNSSYPHCCCSWSPELL